MTAIGFDAYVDRTLSTSYFGVAVTLGSTTVNGIVDVATQDDLHGLTIPQHTTVRVVLVRTGSISPVLGDAITVDGTAYTVADLRLDQDAPDGRLTRILLRST